MGSLNWASTTVRNAPSHYRALRKALIGSTKDGDYHSRLTLSLTQKAELFWWLTKLADSNGTPIKGKDPDIVIFSDASKTGWAQCTTKEVQRKKRHINELELLAMLHAPQTFASNVRDVTVHAYYDNQTAVSYINHRGGTRSLRLNRVSQDIIGFCELRNLTAFYVPGAENWEADEQSRKKGDWADCQLKPEYFARVFEK